MRTSALIALQALVIGAFAQSSGIPIDDPDKGRSREQIGHKVVPGGLAPQVQTLVPRFGSYYKGTQRTKVRYGKYALPRVSDTTFMSLLSGEPGTMSSIATGMKKPCDNCNLVAAQAGLEYANGTEATVSNGAWLHHIVVVTTGTGRRDSVCSLPAERMFSSGNERTPTAFGDIMENKVKVAFPLKPNDGLQMQLELMNMNNVAKDVYITIDWEYIPGNLPAGWKTSKAIWLDVTNCGASSVTPPRGKTQFKLSSREWSSPWDGEMLGVGGHLHDGGVAVNVYQNTKVMCESKARYRKGNSGPNAASGPMRKRDGGPHGADDGKEHIAQMSTCSKMGAIKKGDKVHIDASYDFSKHDGMKSKSGAYTEVMGIAILYIAANL